MSYQNYQLEVLQDQSHQLIVRIGLIKHVVVRVNLCRLVLWIYAPLDEPHLEQSFLLERPYHKLKAVSMDLWQVEHDLGHELHELGETLGEVLTLQFLLADDLAHVPIEVEIDLLHLLIKHFAEQVEEDGWTSLSIL